MLLLSLRGLNIDALKKQLMASNLARSFSNFLSDPQTTKIMVSDYAYSAISQNEGAMQLSQEKFWSSLKIDMQYMIDEEPASVSMAMIKKQGDYPQFWGGEFIYYSNGRYISLCAS